MTFVKSLYSNSLTFLISTIFFFNFTYAVDATLTFGQGSSGQIEILYDFQTDVRGFEFDISGATITGSSGGAASDASFTVSTGSSKVIGYSLSGSVIPAGQGVLTIVNYDSSSIEGSSLAISQGSGDIVGPGGIILTADISDTFSHPVDCGGNYYGSLVDDECSVCDGNGSTCSTVELSFGAASDGSVDVLYSGASRPISGFQFAVSGMDISGVSGDLDTIYENNGKIVGFDLTGAELSAGDGVLATLSYTPTAENSSLSLGVDGLGNVDGAITDDNGNAFATVSFGANLVHGPADCSGAFGGSLVNDDCGICDGDGSSCGDCDGLNDTVTVNDSCGVCGGSGPDSTTGCCADDLGPNGEAQDCAGVCGGDSVEDQCNVCDADSSNDCTQDCAGNWGGSSVNDECSVCDGDGSSCSEVTLSFGTASGGSVDVLYSGASRPISGFQFAVSGMNISSVGGDLDTIYENDGKIVGFDLTGAELSAGDGVLATLSYTASAESSTLSLGVDGLGNVDGAITDDNLNPFATVNFGSDLVHGPADCTGAFGGNTPDGDGDGVCDADEVVGCQDISACDYNQDATDSGECTLPGACDSCSGETDGTGTVVDGDADNDTVCDASDNCPNDANTDQDNNDGDSSGDACDADDDNDGVNDVSDAFPLDGAESSDNDGDGIGDNADADDDNDGIDDTADAFPFDNSESVDTDGDGTGNNADADDDGDGVSDTEDCDSLNPNASEVDCENVCGGGAVCDVTVNIDFGANWNWFSINALSDDMSIGNVLGNSNAGWSEGDYVKAQNSFATYYGDPNDGGYGWQGTLTTMSLERGYKMDLSTSNDFSFVGSPVDPADYPISLSAGWNWIGYPANDVNDINTALGSISNGLYIKGQSEGFSTWYGDPNDGGYGWQGTMGHIKPTYMYMLQMDGADVLTYPSVAPTSYSGVFGDVMGELDFDYRQYEFNGSITAELNIDEVVFTQGDKLIAYVDGEIRGEISSMLFDPTGSYVFPLMVYGNKEDENMSFEYYNAYTDSYYGLGETIQFNPDIIIGDGFNPLVMSEAAPEMPSGSSLNSAYPNPFNPTTTISYNVGEYSYVNVSIYNIQGRIIDNLVSEYKENGSHQITWNAESLPSGVYFVKFDADGFSQTQKLMLIK